MSENTLEFRRKTHAVKIAWGGRVVTIGGMNPIVVQSMTNTSTADVESSVAQVLALARAGSELNAWANMEISEVPFYGHA